MTQADGKFIFKISDLANMISINMKISIHIKFLKILW